MMNYKHIVLLLPFALLGFESDEQLSQLTQLLGPYCNEAEVGSLATCLCYDYSPDGTFEWVYGSTVSDSKADDKPILG